MSTRIVKTVTAALLAAACSAAYGIEGVAQLPRAADELLRIYPSARIHQEQDRVRIIYGAPMTPGLNARDAATRFIAQHGDAFGAGTLQVSEDWSADFGGGGATVFCYQQYIGSIPVEYGMLKVLVRLGPVPQVVYATGILAAAPEGGLGNPAVGGGQALQSLQNSKAWKHVPQWSAPQLVVYQGTGDWVKPVLAWKIGATDPNPAAEFARTFFVSAATGEVIRIRDDISYVDVTGTIRGNGTPGTMPDIAANPPVPLTIPGMRASIAGGGNAYTNPVGEFNIVHGGTAPVTVNCGVNGTGAGQWVNVVPTGTTPLTASVPNITPPGPADLLLNPAPAAGLTAQVNAFIGTNLTHNHFKDRAPTFTRLDLAIPANTGVSGSCNAFYTNNTINFFNAGGGCVNSCYSSVVSHEYGHFVVAHLGPTGGGLAQNAFGEGYGDTTAVLVWDDPIIARQFYNTGLPIRDPVAANMQYPCSGPIHDCGQVLTGVWWRILGNMRTAYGTDDGRERTRQLHVNWSLITAGGPNSSNAAGPATAIEVLTADDNNGNINDGTPNWFRICPGFAGHSIVCPALQLLNFEYPNGRPTTIVPGQPNSIAVNVVGNAGTPQPGSGTLSYRVDSGPFTTIPMIQGAPNQYTAVIPATPCPHVINYYVGAQTTSSITATDPMNAPASFYTTAVGVISTNTVLDADFNQGIPAGWTTTGLWHLSGACAPTGTPCTGPQWIHYGQDSTCNYMTGTANSGLLTSPPITIPPAPPGGEVTLTYCYALQTENASNYDKAQVFVNNTSGAQLDRAPDAAGWTTRQVNMAAYAGQTINLVFSFNSIDGFNNAFRGWQIGRISVAASQVVCGTCYANCDGTTTPPVLNVNDFVCFQSRFAAGDSYANCDGSTTPPVLNVNDFVCFQSQFAAGCP